MSVDRHGYKLQIYLYFKPSKPGKYPGLSSSMPPVCNAEKVQDDTTLMASTGLYFLDLERLPPKPQKILLIWFHRLSSITMIVDTLG